ncbi:MAG: hypothetical protein KBT35_05825 [Firmicutes bacterium]|nr:hypothetical protein [Candidatus Colivicinus equi]
MEKNLIKVLNPNKAEELAKLGFKYNEERCGDVILYTFFNSEELMKYIHKNFGNNDFLLTNKMNF